MRWRMGTAKPWRYTMGCPNQVNAPKSVAGPTRDPPAHEYGVGPSDTSLSALDEPRSVERLKGNVVPADDIQHMGPAHQVSHRRDLQNHPIWQRAPADSSQDC